MTEDFPRPPGRSRSASSSSSFGRFAPGTLIDGRYRIAGLLGRGGMGEVMRAVDEDLDQEVALKFLPEGVAQDEGKLERFLEELRLARQVTHPNVCRVFDIGGIDSDRPYISMELVDGENLASLLRRIGRPTHERAVRIARQLCAGLNAAHSRGILHRDLKPANIMVDGRGDACMTDFGLAAVGRDEASAIVGTPDYIAPEVIAGRGASVSSDLYSLGCVLYELFSGRRPFDSREGDDSRDDDSSEVDLGERLRRHREDVPLPLRDRFADIEPRTEDAILRCLAKDPAGRPSSALAVSALLPGGDPVAEALAAGETPSPDAVADSGQSGVMSPALAFGLTGFMAFGLLLVAFFAKELLLVERVGSKLPPAVLEHRAREILATLGHEGRDGDHAFGFSRSGRYLRHVVATDDSPQRWERLGREWPGALNFWYVQSPSRLLPKHGFGLVRPGDPPLLSSGMVELHLSTSGRLVHFEAVPTRWVEDEDLERELDWALVFEEAGLDLAEFEEAEPGRWLPATPFDERRAFAGLMPGVEELALRVEAEALHGRLVRFQLTYPWDRSVPGTRRANILNRVPGAQRWMRLLSELLFLAAIFGTLVVARRNWVKDRVDRRGATRLAVWTFTILILMWLLTGFRLDRIQGPATLIRPIGGALFASARNWLLYLAIEPAMRRIWPERLVSWSRLTAGRVRDPLVGREVLLGMVLGMSVVVLERLQVLLAGWFGHAPPTPFPTRNGMLEGVRQELGVMFELLSTSIFIGLWFLLIFVLLRLLTRRLPWLGYVIFFLGLTISYSSRAASEVPWIDNASAVIVAGIGVYAFARLGVVGIIAAAFTYLVVQVFPLTLDFDAWYAGAGAMGALVVLGLASTSARLATGRGAAALPSARHLQD